MNDSTSQLLNQLTTSSQTATSPALNGLQTYITWFFWLGLISTVIITAAFVVYVIYKMRVQSAILRIDKNLQKLVDHQIGTENPPRSVEEPDEATTA